MIWITTGPSAGGWGFFQLRPWLLLALLTRRWWLHVFSHPHVFSSRSFCLLVFLVMVPAVLAVLIVAGCRQCPLTSGFGAFFGQGVVIHGVKSQ